MTTYLINRLGEIGRWTGGGRYRGIAVMVGLCLPGMCGHAPATTFEIGPSNANDKCAEEFENLANGLQPGDELILSGGTYTQSCRRAITVNGTAAKPIVIRAASGERPLLTRPADNIDSQNNIEIKDSSHLMIRGLRFQGGSTGVRFIGGDHITLEDSEIFDTGNNALSMNSGNSDSFVIRRNHIHHTGLSDSGTTEGEGMYIGCNNDACRTTNSVIEGNYIHHLRSNSSGGNDGIEVKAGSYGNVIRDNVIHDTIIGKQYPCIFVYGGGQDVNIVEGNVMWNCGEGIQVVSDAIVRNNIVLNSLVRGITAAPHGQIAQMRDVTIVNNTVFGHPTCLYIRWLGAVEMTLANNAFYCVGATAINGGGLNEAGITTRANYVTGNLLGVSLDAQAFISGGGVGDAFVNVLGNDFWPAPDSLLLGNAIAALAPATDFNATARNGAIDVGAYEVQGLDANPGWTIAADFKGGQKPIKRPLPPTNFQVR